MVLTESASAGAALNTALLANITPSIILEQFIAILGWVGAMVGIVFLITKAVKLIKGASRGKVRL